VRRALKPVVDEQLRCHHDESERVDAADRRSQQPRVPTLLRLVHQSVARIPTHQQRKGMGRFALLGATLPSPPPSLATKRPIMSRIERRSSYWASLRQNKTGVCVIRKRKLPLGSQRHSQISSLCVCARVLFVYCSVSPQKDKTQPSVDRSSQEYQLFCVWYIRA